MTDVLDNPRVHLGANGPPEPTPFDAFDAHLSDLMETAKGFLDGEGVNSEAEATAVSRLLDDARKAGKDADAQRAAEKKPHDDAAKAVQAKWKPLLERAELVSTTARRALAPWLAKLEAEQRAAAAARRAEAVAAAEAARQAAQAARTSDLAAAEEASRLADAAKAAEKVASKAEGAEAHATGGARATGLRSVWRAEVDDLWIAVGGLWRSNPEAFRPLVEQLASAEARGARRPMPGVSFHEDRVV